LEERALASPEVLAFPDVKAIEEIDTTKQNRIASRAKEILQKWSDKATNKEEHVLNEATANTVNADMVRDDAKAETKTTPIQTMKILKDVESDVKKEISFSIIKDQDESLKTVAKKIYPDLNKSLQVLALDENLNEIFKAPMKEIMTKVTVDAGIKYLFLDGFITQRLIDTAKQTGIRCIIGHHKNTLKNTDGIVLKTFNELLT